jgi:hypothetical protein
MDLNDSSIPIIGQKKPRFCKICAKNAHPFTTKCQYNALVERIEQLIATNSFGSDTLQKVTIAADTFRQIALDTAKAMEVCERTIMSLPNGEEIWTKVTKNLEEVWEKTSPPGIEETAENSSPGNTTQSEKENKISIAQTPPGESTANVSSELIRNATRAESEPPLLIT